MFKTFRLFFSVITATLALNVYAECPHDEDRISALCELQESTASKHMELHYVYSQLLCEVNKAIEEKRQSGDCVDCDKSDSHISAGGRLIESQRNWEKYKDNFCHMRYKLIFPGADASITELNCQNQYISKRISELRDELNFTVSLGGDHNECIEPPASNKALKAQPSAAGTPQSGAP